MQHKFIKVLAIDILDHCSLRVRFDNGRVREINLEPVLYGELYEPLRNHDFFRQAIVDDEAGTIVWPNGADFDPDLLYAWDEHVEAFATQMRKVAQS